MTLPPDTVPDDSAALARRMVERLTALLAVMPGNWYYLRCLEGWKAELAKQEEQTNAEF